MITEVAAEMSANVWKVLVGVGDTVGELDTVAILESMKMEIPVYAGVDGTVEELLVAEGETIAEGDTIARIASA
jgi:biotin carboxyl carrier protein